MQETIQLFCPNTFRFLCVPWSIDWMGWARRGWAETSSGEASSSPGANKTTPTSAGGTTQEWCATSGSSFPLFFLSLFPSRTTLFFPLLHLLESVVAPRLLFAGVGIDFLLGLTPFETSSSVVSSSASARITASPFVPATPPPATQTPQLLIQKAIVVTPELTDGWDVRRILQSVSISLPDRSTVGRGAGSTTRRQSLWINVSCVADACVCGRLLLLLLFVAVLPTRFGLLH